MKDNILLFDGAMGTSLHSLNLTERCPELYNIQNPKEIEQIHSSFIESGADFIETNTFGANSLKLSKFGIENKIKKLNERAVSLAKNAANGTKVKVVGSIGSCGELPYPLGKGDFSFYEKTYSIQAQTLIDSGVDSIILETFSSFYELKCVLKLIKSYDDKIPVIISPTFSNAKTLFGGVPEIFARAFSYLKANIIASNCSGGGEQLLPVCESYANSTSLPILIMPNAGLPIIKNGKTIFPEQAESFSRYAEKLVELGASLIGGCCGTTPLHIKKLKEKVAEMQPIKRQVLDIPFVCSERVISYNPLSNDIKEFKNFEDMTEFAFESDNEPLIIDVKNMDSQRVVASVSEFCSMLNNPLIFKNVSSPNDIDNAYNGISVFL